MPSSLEKSYTLADGSSTLVANCQSRVAVVVTHPWGPLGGNMHNNVVVAVVLYFQRLGITTVRFNFTGSQFGRGLIQVEQVKTVAALLVKGDLFPARDKQEKSEISSVFAEGSNGEESKKQILPKHVILVGYSYGSLIAASASSAIQDCIACISIAPPFGVMHWLLAFNSDYHMQQAAISEGLARLFLIGDRDNFTSETHFKSFIDERFPSSSTTTGAVIKGADHFFGRREKDVMDVVGEWLLHTFSQCQNDISKLRDMQFGVDI